MQVLDQIAMDRTMKTCILVALQKTHVESGKVLATVMLNVWTILIVVNSIAISHLILQIIAVFKNLTAAIQVCVSIQIKRICFNLYLFLFVCLANRSLSCHGLDNGSNECEEADSTCVVKKIGMIHLFLPMYIKYHNENIIGIFQEKSIHMVVHSRIMQREFSRQEDLINFVSGGMVPKTVTLFAFVKLMNAILD